MAKHQVPPGHELQMVFEDTLKEIATLPAPRTNKIRGISLGKIDQGIAKIMLINDDTLSAANKLRIKYPTKRILILNFANNDSFCDAKANGFGGGTTQEEDIARRTNLYSAMTSLGLYPISSGINGSGVEFLVSNAVSVIKDVDNVKLVDPFYVNVLSAAAIVNPRQKHLPTITVNGSEVDDVNNMAYNYANQWDADVMQAKIKNIMNYARASCDILVLGAWGMGAFHNPEYGLIQLWNNELGVIPKKDSGIVVVFAIPGDTNGYTMKCFKRFLKRI